MFVSFHLREAQKELTMLCRAIYSTNMCAARLNGSKVFVEEVRKAFLPCLRHSLILIYVKVGTAGSAPYRTSNLFAYCMLRGIWLPPRFRKYWKDFKARKRGAVPHIWNSVGGLVLLVVRCRMLVSSRLCLVGVLPSAVTYSLLTEYPRSAILEYSILNRASW
jgi:hypothetical protein